MMSNIFKARADIDEIVVFYSENITTKEKLLSDLKCSFASTIINRDFRLERGDEYKRGAYLSPLKIENTQITECTSEEINGLGFEERKKGSNSWIIHRLLNDALDRYSKLNSDIYFAGINKGYIILFNKDELNGDYTRELIERVQNVENDIPEKFMVFNPQIRLGFRLFHRAYLEADNYYIFAVIEPILDFRIELNLKTLSYYMQNIEYNNYKVYFTYKPESERESKHFILKGISEEGGKKVALLRSLDNGNEVVVKEDKWDYVKLNRVYSSFFYKEKLKELFEIEYRKLRDIRVNFLNNLRKNNIIKENIKGINKKFYNNVTLGGSKFELTEHYLEFATEI